MLDFINNECGGLHDGRKLLAVIPGGSSVNVMTADDCQGVCLDYESLKKAGSALGCAGFMVLDDRVDPIEAVLNLSHFYKHESCGQCTPCREGAHWIEKIFRRIARGGGKPGDIELIESLCDQIGGHTICAFGDTMILPYLSFLKKFRGHFVKRIQDGIRGVVPGAQDMEFEDNHHAHSTTGGVGSAGSHLGISSSGNGSTNGRAPETLVHIQEGRN
jgi:NADH-quinone oxidoreductase subunit F